MTFSQWIEKKFSYTATQLIYKHGNKYVRDLEEEYIKYCNEKKIEPVT